MMEKLFNSSIKQPTGTSPNALVFGGLIDAKQGFLMTEPKITKTKHTRSIRDHVYKLMHQQSTLIAVALKVQRTQDSKILEIMPQQISEPHAYTQHGMGMNFLRRFRMASSHTTYPASPEITSHWPFFNKYFK